MVTGLSMRRGGDRAAAAAASFSCCAAFSASSSGSAMAVDTLANRDRASPFFFLASFVVLALGDCFFAAGGTEGV